MNRAGDIVRYVDDTNNEQLGVLVADPDKDGIATVYPLSQLLTISSLTLGLKSIAGLQINTTAGGPPYWIPSDGG